MDVSELTVHVVDWDTETYVDMARDMLDGPYKLKSVHGYRNQREWLDALPEDVTGALPAVVLLATVGDVLMFLQLALA